MTATIVAADAEGAGDLLPFDADLDVEAIQRDAVLELFTLYAQGIEAYRRQYGRAKNPRLAKQGSRSLPAPRPPAWQKQFGALRKAIQSASSSTATPLPLTRRKVRQFLYAINLRETSAKGRVVVELFCQEQLKNGGWGAVKMVRSTKGELLQMADDIDRPLLDLLFGNESVSGYYYSHYSVAQDCVVNPALYDVVLPRLCATGRCGLIPDEGAYGADAFTPVIWDPGLPWRFEVDWTLDQRTREWCAEGTFVRRSAEGADESVSLERSELVLANGLVVFPDRVASLEPIPVEKFQWLTLLRKEPQWRVPEAEQDKFVAELLSLPRAAQLNLPEPMRWETIAVEPIPRVSIAKPKEIYAPRGRLFARVSFDYQGTLVRLDDPIDVFVQPGERRAMERDRKREAERWQELRAAGFVNPESYFRKEADWQLSTNKLSSAVLQLASKGWSVEAEGLTMRRPGKINISVTSGVDWFDLTADCDFDGIKVMLPALLAAVEQGQNFIELGDGSRGMLPEDWLAKYAPLAELGKTEGDSLRFLPSQAMLLDALLAAQPEAQLDEAFARVRAKLRDFSGVAPVHEPASFRGQLRDYQRAGLGWLRFLEEFGFGGCLADDMGLGKTVQVLALLEAKRVELGSTSSRETKIPKKASQVQSLKTLVVAPKSLVFNWLDEAKRFTPELRTLDYTGLARKASRETLAEVDLIVTTYGTLRRDILALREIEFELVILDEAQAIKNPGSQSAKACRLLQSRNRLAMTGTPVENHLGDLWSIFEFLNPGMLGRSSNLRLFAGKSLPDKSSVELLAKALRPFLLRRTKEQVLKELPDKTEQTLYCELEDKQRQLYDELRDHYRALLTKKIREQGLAKSKIQVLEALLRLRQAACHPALIDKSKANIPSAKLETLLEQLDEVLSERHKVLIFSQFTSLLSLVKQELDRRGIVYEYLDGKSVRRKEKVERFQTDADCPVFLISLKAGGHGLNLTAADYVFILDPWWNPAVEAQAVDRAHRIGQSKPVFAYRLIARDTVEEKILELQSQKRSLADAVITADANLLRALSAEDLQLLLS